MNEGERLKSLCTALGMTQVEFAKSVGKTQGALAQYIVRQSIPKSVITEIVKNHPCVSILWLLTGEGDMFLSAPKEGLKEKQLEVVHLDGGYVVRDDDAYSIVFDCDIEGALGEMILASARQSEVDSFQIRYRVQPAGKIFFS